MQQFQLQHDRQLSGSLKRPHSYQGQGPWAAHLFMVCMLAVCLFMSTPITVHAQTKPKAAAPVAATPPEAPAAPCIIAEFRHIALTHHDPQERQNKVIEWLKKSGPSCSPTQMSIVVASRASLLGTADSFAVSAVMDGLMEKRLASDHAAVSRYYRPETQAPAKGKEEASPVTTTESGPAPKPGAGGSAGAAAGGAAMGAPAVVAMAGMPGQGAAQAAPNISINMGGPKPPEEDMSRKYPPPTEALFVFPPEFGVPSLNYFGKIRRQFVRSFFMETLSPGKCPEGMAWRNDACEAGMKVAWRFGEKLPQGAKTFPVDPKLVEKLNFDPSYTFVRAGGDILALERDTGKVADAVLNLGKPA